MKECSVPDCSRPHSCNGYCNIHDMRVRRYGDPNITRHRPRNTDKSIREFILENCSENANGCWIWSGYTERGYGRMSYQGKQVLIHRLMFALEHGVSLDSLAREVICHQCDTPGCVNPAHLFRGTQVENIKDRDTKNRQARGKQVGSAKLTEENVWEIKKSSDSRRVLANRFGVSTTAIDYVRKGKTWQHLSGV